MNPFKKNLFLALGIFLAAIVFFIIVLWLMGGSIKAKAEQLSVVDTKLGEINANFSSLAALKQQYNGKAVGYLTIINNVVPLKDNLINFLKDFTILADASHLAGFGLDLVGETPPTAESLGWVSITSGPEGSIEQFISFLDSLPKINYLVSFNSATLSRRGQNFQFNLKGRVFFREQ